MFYGSMVGREDREEITKKIFFGWYIVAAALVLAIYNGTLFGYGFTAFINPIAATFGWSLAQVSLALSLRTFEVGVLDPFVGMVSDRWPGRPLMFLGILILAGGIVCFSLARNLAVFYLGFLLVGLGSACSVGMVPTTVVSRWFNKDIGKASGILATGVAVGGLFSPLLVKGIDALGWQTFMIYMAGGMVAIGLPLSFVFRDRPEDYGLTPDGRQSGMTTISDVHDQGLSLKQALKTRTFWLNGISQTLQIVAMNSVTIHLMPYLTSLGMERSRAAVALTIFAIVSMGARPLYGFLADVFPKRYMLAASSAITTAGLIVFGMLDGSSFAMVVLFAVIYAIGGGGAQPLRAPIIREYFGVKSFGAIYGVSVFLAIFGGSVSAPITGWVYDTRGTYNPIWFIYAGLTAAAAVLAMFLPQPYSASERVVGEKAH